MSNPIKVRVGDMQIQFETVPMPGTEPTSSKADTAAEHALGAFERAQSAIAEIASSTVQTIEQSAKCGARPDRLELEFGVKFSAHGDVVVAGVAGEAGLLVRLVYERNGEPGKSP
jgi:hypothetical protein